MKKYIISIAVFFVCLSAGAAITEKYVSSSANEGTSDGTSGAPYSFAEMVTEINAGSAAGNRYNIKDDGTYTLGATVNLTAGGTQTAPVILRGYTTTITDGYLGRSPENGVLVTTNMPLIEFSSTSFNLTMTGDYIVFENLQLSASTSGTAWNSDTGCVFLNCKISSSSTNSAGVALSVGNRSSAINCDVFMTGASSGTAAIIASTTMSRIIGCRVNVTSTAAWTIRLTGATVVVDNMLIGGAGLRLNSASAVPFIYGNTIVNSSTDAISMVTTMDGPQFIMNNHITDNAGDGIDMFGTGNSGVILWNRLRDNGTSIANGNDWQTVLALGQVDDGTTGDTSTDYVDYGAGDYRLKATAPGTSAGFPTQRTIGAFQLNQEGSVGGSSETSHTFVK